MVELFASTRFWAITGSITALTIASASIWSTYQSASAKPATVSISMTEPKDGIVARCATIGGRAPVITDLDVWVATARKNGGFGLAAASQRGDGSWEARITVGEENESGTTYPLYAFFLPKAQSAFISGIRAYASDGQAGYFHARTIPPEAKHRMSRLVTRDSTSTARCETSTGADASPASDLPG